MRILVTQIKELTDNGFFLNLFLIGEYLLYIMC